MENSEKKYSVDFLKLAHKEGSSSHKDEMLESDLAGCFHCKKVFSTKEINEWIKEKIGETAVCPKCGIDSVLSCKFPISDKIFLKEMCKYWFNE